MPYILLHLPWNILRSLTSCLLINRVFGNTVVLSDKLPEKVTDLALRYDGGKSIHRDVTFTSHSQCINYSSGERRKKFHPGQQSYLISETSAVQLEQYLEGGPWSFRQYRMCSQPFTALQANGKLALGWVLGEGSVSIGISARNH